MFLFARSVSLPWQSDASQESGHAIESTQFRAVMLESAAQLSLFQDLQEGEQRKSKTLHSSNSVLRIDGRMKLRYVVGIHWGYNTSELQSAFPPSFRLRGKGKLDFPRGAVWRSDHTFTAFKVSSQNILSHEIWVCSRLVYDLEQLQVSDHNPIQNQPLNACKNVFFQQKTPNKKTESKSVLSLE